MARPGVVVTSRAEAPPRSAATDAGMAFMLGKTEKGPAVALVTSMTQYQTLFGVRTAFTDAYDGAETFFQEGGTKLTVARAADAAGVDTALAALTKDLGPGQVFMPGALGGAPATQTALVTHAAANNRIALLDPLAADAGDKDDLIALAGTFTNTVNARYAALFAPVAVVPGLTSADTRSVSYSAVEAGIMSRNAGLYSPNVPAAGVNGQSRFAINLSAAFADVDREELNDNGVNVAKLVYGGVRTYGYRTLAPLSTGWGLLSNARLNMEIVAKAEEIGERYLFSQIDGRRVRISQFGADLTGMLVPYYEAGSLFGTSVDDAFYVDVGPAVNTLASIAAGELRAILALRMSPFAEYVVIEIVKVATETPLAVVAAA
jgi:hypothetical protein